MKILDILHPLCHCNDSSDSFSRRKLMVPNPKKVTEKLIGRFEFRIETFRPKIRTLAENGKFFKRRKKYVRNSNIRGF